MWKIYGLVDPREGVIRYVGCTVKSARVRLLEHVSGARCYPMSRHLSTRWIAGLLRDGITPSAVVLRDGIKALDEACAQEAAWIIYLRSRGLPLTNAKRISHARGGDLHLRVSAAMVAGRVNELVSELMSAA